MVALPKLTWVWAGIGLLAWGGCVHAPPESAGGSASTPVSQGAIWAPPRAAVPSLRVDSLAPGVPPDLIGRVAHLSLADAVDLALANSPQTAVSWRQARAAAAAWGSARGRWLPTLTADLSGGPSKVISPNLARFPANRTTFATSATLTYLLFDFGGRAGSVDAAREGLFAADFTHNATLQNVALQTADAYFNYQAGRGLATAALASLETARANLAAAEKRHDVGLATIADVLQAKTAQAQAQLNFQSAEGNLQAARGGLALALGLSASIRFDAEPDSIGTPTGDIAESVDSLIARAVRERPDLAAAEAQARQADAQVQVSRSAQFPSLGLSANTTRTYADASALQGTTYTLGFDLSIPLFSGLSRQYDVVAAREQANAALARAGGLRVQVTAQVFTAYFALRTASQRVVTTKDLLASAERSEAVARGRYGEGVGSILDVLTAQSALADARSQQVQAHWGWYAALAQLTHDVGILGLHGDSPIRVTGDSTGGGGR